MISVAIPFHNAERYLSYAILSVINQSYDDWELILVNDGSTDDSLEIATNYSKLDSRIRVLDDGTNRKLPYRLNQIITESKGTYIARMDADDVMHPERLQKQFNFLNENSDYDLVSTGLISIDNNNIVKGFRNINSVFHDFSEVKLSYPIVHPSVMARIDWYHRNNYSENYPRAEDFELWTRAITIRDFNMAILPDLLLFYREEGNLDIHKILGSYKDTLKIYERYYPKTGLNIDVLKLNLKILVAKALNYSGNLQHLASRRNNKFIEEERVNFQIILNNITNKD